MTKKDLQTINEIDILEAIMKLKEDGILYVYFKPNIMLDIELQKKLLKCYREITQNKPTPFLFESGEGVVITKEARENAIIIENQSPCNATAVVVTSLAYKLIAKFYFQFHKPSIPHKVFSNVLEARMWLKNHIIVK